ncbi:head GIN domain-containing protein [Pseudoduganella sp. GCM10020061]|uniref:head GIN domain-containing protein n=1 Tax=Pseudoduganella sp. GCM10020061 TaxID=3317345 RepID=UPI00362E1F8A
MHKPSNKNMPLRRKALYVVTALAFALPAAGALAGGSSWFGGDEVKGSGVSRTQARATGHFTGVELSLPAAAEVRIGATEGITIEADDNLLPMIETVVERGVLKVRPARDNLYLRSRNMKIVVTARSIDRLSLDGSGSITTGPLRAEKISLAVGGSGTINVGSVDADRVSVAVGGSGDIRVGGGQASRLSVTIGGSGDVDAGGLKVGDAGITVGGSGTSTVWVTNRLSYTIAGSGDVRYYGDPRISRTVVGSGDAERLGAAPR